MRGGYHGQLLRVDLSSRECVVEPLDEGMARQFLGGNGFAARILFDELAAIADPLSEDNILVLATGPWNDTPIPGSSRACIAAKSPLTGIFYDSTFGGRFPTTFKRTGYDLLVVTGRAKKPCYLIIDEDGVDFRPARGLAGKTVRQTVKAIQVDEGVKTDVLAIGPAGENLVRFASAGHYWQNREGIAGRGGMGAVMGSKQLKAIAVRGARRTPLAHEAELKTYVRDYREEVRTGTAGLIEYGTAMLANFLNKLGAIGTRNFSCESWDLAERVSGERLKEEYWDRNTTCFVCPVACGKDVKITQGRFAGTHTKIPEWETIYAFGPMLENSNIEVIIKASELCDDVGVDTITMGVTLAFAYECFERGLLTEAQVGRPLRFGDPEPILELIELTARRQGIGALLAEGSARLAVELGAEAEKSLICVKGLELPGHSPRALKGMSIGYATGTRGGSHHDTRPTPFYVGEADRFSIDDAPAYAVRSQNFTAVGDSLVQCRFVSERGGYGLFLNDTYAFMLKCATGWEFSIDELESLGARICNLERAFNVRENVRRHNDRLPYKIMHDPIPDGPSAGMHCPDDELQGMLDAYYGLRGWDQDGVPKGETLDGLGLADVARALVT